MYNSIIQGCWEPLAFNPRRKGWEGCRGLLTRSRITALEIYLQIQLHTDKLYPLTQRAIFRGEANYVFLDGWIGANINYYLIINYIKTNNCSVYPSVLIFEIVFVDYKQCFGYGSGSSDPFPMITDPDPR